VRAAGLRPAESAARQLAFGDRAVGWREAEQAVDQIARRFGSDAIRPAALVPGDRQPPSSGPSASSGPTPSSTARGQARILGNEPGM
jgi:DNA polymerase IV